MAGRRVLWRDWLLGLVVEWYCEAVDRELRDRTHSHSSLWRWSVEVIKQEVQVNY